MNSLNLFLNYSALNWETPKENDEKGIDRPWGTQHLVHLQERRFGGSMHLGNVGKIGHNHTE
jgi:hypothetical protein